MSPRKHALFGMFKIKGEFHTRQILEKLQNKKVKNALSHHSCKSFQLQHALHFKTMGTRNIGTHVIVHYNGKAIKAVYAGTIKDKTDGKSKALLFSTHSSGPTKKISGNLKYDIYKGGVEVIMVPTGTKMQFVSMIEHPTR